MINNTLQVIHRRDDPPRSTRFFGTRCGSSGDSGEGRGGGLIGGWGRFVGSGMRVGIVWRHVGREVKPGENLYLPQQRRLINVSRYSLSLLLLAP